MLVPAAVAAGIERMVISPPDSVVGADPGRVGTWARQGATVELCLAMLVGPRSTGSPVEADGRVPPRGRRRPHDLLLRPRTEPQKGNPLPITAYRRMVRALLDAGTAEDDITAMVGGNAGQLLGP